MDLKDPKEMWNKLKSICTEVSQGVIYSILQELLYYPKITKHAVRIEKQRTEFLNREENLTK